MLRAFFNELRLRIESLLKRKQLEDELAYHLEMRARKNREAGMNDEEARYAATRNLGNVTRLKEISREMWTFAWLETFWQDVRYGTRTLRKNSGFTVVAVLTLALGIGANTAVFSVVNSVLLESLPYSQEKRIVMIWETNARTGHDHNVVSPANFLYWQDHNTVFDQMAAFYDDTSTLTGEGEPEQIPSQAISTNLFPLLGISPVLGRDFSKDEGLREHNRVVLLSYELWQRRFGNDRGVINKRIELDGISFLVVGVMPPHVTLFAAKGSRSGKVAQLWFPYGWRDDDRKPGGRWMSAVARLKDGVSLSQAQTEILGLIAEITKIYPDFEAGWGINLVPVHQDLVSDVRLLLLVLLGTVGFVLLITCANVANLLLSQSTGRQREFAVRCALGATGWRVTQQSLIESILLAALGGIFGIVAARWIVTGLVLLIPQELHVAAVHLNWRVVAFTACISLLTGILFGVVPAVDTARANLSDALREGGRGETGARGHRLRNVFALAQISLSLVLLAGAGLLIQSFIRLSGVNPGFNPRNLLMARVDLPSTKYPKDVQSIDFFQRLLEQVRALPGVRAATTDNSFPLTGVTPGTSFNIVGKPTPPPGQDRVTEVQIVGSDYFRTMNGPLLRGRTFTNREETLMSHVVIISEQLARQFFPDEDPLGQKLIIDMKEKNEPCEIIGIVGDVKRAGLGTVPVAMSYWPHPELAYSSLMVAVRTEGDPLAKVSAIRDILHRMDPDLPLSDVATMDQSLADSVARQRFGATLITIFAGIALFLAAIGIYGVVAHAMSFRTREFGIRMALGAESGDLAWIVLRHGAALAGVGVLIGLVGTLALTQLIRGLLFQVSAHDPTTIAGVAAFLAAVVLAACWIPARRAMRADPIVALRYE
jgi:putative ABC transport system permease protein